MRTSPIDNPYQSPAAENESSPRSTRHSWRAYLWANGGLLVLLLVSVATSFFWRAISEASAAAQLGDRYATYDHEFIVYPVPVLAIIVGLFVFVNLVVFVVRSARAYPKRNQAR